MRVLKFAAFVCAGLALLTTLARAQSPRPVPAPRAFPISRQAFVPVNNPVTPNYPTLVFDAETKEYDAKPGEMMAPFLFHLTNVWTNEIRIDQVHASCGCTTARLPSIPWHLAPGASGEVSAQVNLAGKPAGMITKTLTFYTSVGNRIVSVKVLIPHPAGDIEALSPEERTAAMTKAVANAKAIFEPDCAKCHVKLGEKSFGENLFAADCGICHESSHRASSVPDLHALKVPTNLEYWKTIISFGKAHTMMPGFAISQGGPLTAAQIDSLAGYLDRVISHHFSDVPMTNAALASPALRGPVVQ